MYWRLRATSCRRQPTNLKHQWLELLLAVHKCHCTNIWILLTRTLFMYKSQAMLPLFHFVDGLIPIGLKSNPCLKCSAHPASCLGVQIDTGGPSSNFAPLRLLMFLFSSVPADRLQFLVASPRIEYACKMRGWFHSNLIIPVTIAFDMCCKWVYSCVRGLESCFGAISGCKCLSLLMGGVHRVTHWVMEANKPWLFWAMSASVVVNFV